MAKRNKASSKPSDTGRSFVNFQAEPALRKLLEEEATKHGFEKPNLYARHLLERALTNVDHAELRFEVNQVQEQIRRVREDIATVAKMVLIRMAGASPAKAESWVRENLLT